MSKSVTPPSITQQTNFSPYEAPSSNIRSFEQLFKETVPENFQHHFSIIRNLPSKDYLLRLLPKASDTEKWAKISQLFDSIESQNLFMTLDALSTNARQLNPLPNQEPEAFWQETGQRIFNNMDPKRPAQTSMKEIEKIRQEIESKSPKTRSKLASFGNANAK